jgi:chromosome segregation ATPase
VNKEINERLNKLESQIATLKEAITTSLSDAKNMMTEALIAALKEQIEQHEKKYHDFSGKYGK